MDEPYVEWLRAQVDQAVGDVRRAESVAPAAIVAALVSGVPLLLILVVTLMKFVSLS
jgi:hypothetical protein